MNSNFKSSNVKIGIYTKNGDSNNKIQFEFYTDVDYKKKIEFINRVVPIVVGDNYYPFLFDVAFNFAIISILTNINIENIYDSESPIDDMIEFFNSNNAIDIVRKNLIQSGLWQELKEIVEQNIEMKTGIHKSYLEESITGLINTYKEKFEGLDMTKLTDFADSVSSIKGDVTPERLFEAYSKTDAFKENQKSIGDDKNKQIVDLKQKIQELVDNNSSEPVSE